MSKPPFVIPTVKGPALWPTVTRTPAAVRVRIIPAPGMSPEEIAAAQTTVVRMIANASGVIKQNYLSFRQGCDLGIVNNTSRVFPLAIGITGICVQNGPHETLTIVVNVSELIEAGIVPVPKRIAPSKYFMLIYDLFGGSPGGGGLFAGFRFSTPETVFVGSDIGIDLTYEAYYNGKPVLTFPSAAFGEGSDVVVADPRPIFDDGIREVVVELHGQWALQPGEPSHDLTVAVLLFDRKDNSDIPGVSDLQVDAAMANVYLQPASAIKFFQSHGIPLVERIERRVHLGADIIPDAGGPYPGGDRTIGFVRLSSQPWALGKSYQLSVTVQNT